MTKESVGWFGDLQTTRWRLALPPGRVLDRVEREASRAGLGATFLEHGFRLWVRRLIGLGRRNVGPFLEAGVRRSEGGSVLEFSIGTSMGPAIWLMPLILASAAVGGGLGFFGYLSARSGEPSSLVCGLSCAAFPVGLISLGLVLSGVTMNGKSKRMLRFLRDTFEDVRVLDVEAADGPAAQAPPPRSRWRAGVLAAVVPLLVGAALGVLVGAVGERQAERDRALVAPVREVEAADLARVRFSPTPTSTFREPIVVEEAFPLEAVCEALRSGRAVSIGKSDRIDWTYELTLEWADGGTSLCEIKKAGDRILLRIREHRGEQVSSGDYELGPQGRMLLDPRELQT